MMSSSANFPDVNNPAVVTPGQLRRERLRFTSFDLERTPVGLCSVTIGLEWLDGDRIIGTASGQSSPLGDLRVAAEATLRAIEQFSHGALRLELIGVKAMRAFDANVVIVCVSAHESGGERRLLGCHLAEHDPLRSAVVAVLGATNRLLGNFIATR